MQADEGSLRLITKVIIEKGFIDIPAEGTSMFPLIEQGDICRFVSCETSMLKRGDVVLFLAPSGPFVAHRYYKTLTEGNRTLYMFKGDTNISFDEPIVREQIIGRLEFVRKAKRTIYTTRLAANLWSFLILFFPWSSQLLRVHLIRKGRLQS